MYAHKDQNSAKAECDYREVMRDDETLQKEIKQQMAESSFEVYEELIELHRLIWGYMRAEAYWNCSCKRENTRRV